MSYYYKTVGKIRPISMQTQQKSKNLFSGYSPYVCNVLEDLYSASLRYLLRVAICAGLFGV